MENHPTQSLSPWWGRHQIETGHIDFWQIGPLSLWAEHLSHQWKITWQHGEDWLDSTTRVIKGALRETVPQDRPPIHCAFQESSNDLILSPALADRPVVTRLSHPLYVLPGERVSLYVISPLWLRIEMAEPMKLLYEVPLFRLSDTWFGPMLSPITHGLCYASTAPAFAHPGEVPFRAHCAITAVTVRNLSATSSLLIDRISVPLPRLSLFHSPRTGFWTDAITLERNESSDLATLKLDRQPPADASPAQFVTGPRIASNDSGTMLRAFSALLRERSES
jgi:hypothetical protein